jgi:hypothetical protein
MATPVNIPDDNELKIDYANALRDYRKTITAVIELHAKSRHLPMQGVTHLTRLMFARLMLLGGNLSRLCPDAESDALWDFSSIALLSRSLFEAILFFRYFIDETGLEEMLARVHVLHLYDNSERVRLFKKLGKDDEAAKFQGAVQYYRDLLKMNPFFKGLEINRQKELLNASRASLLNLSEMSEKYANDESTWVIHQLLSHYAHSHPLSFIRNDENRRDGLANRLDWMYIPGILRWLISLLEDAAKAYGQVRIGLPGDSQSEIRKETTILDTQDALYEVDHPGRSSSELS